MIDTEALRKKILDFAIEGKITERDDEANTSELFMLIQQEKAYQLKNGLLKKTKEFPQITQDKIPGKFPEEWHVCYIDDIAFVTKLAGFEYTKYIADNIQSEGIPLFKGKNVQHGELVLEFESYIPQSVSDELPRSQLKKKCLLTPYVGTIGNIAIFESEFDAHLGSNVGKIELLNSENEKFLLEEYVLYYLRSSYGFAELTKHRKATAQDSISIEAIRNVIIPIPSLKEQRAIVDKVDEILVQLEVLDELQQQYSSDLEVLKSKIIDAGIQGKLTEQLPEDGTAEELLKQIDDEKKKLIKEKKIKATEALPEITEDEIPFEIPDNWKWVRLEGLTANISIPMADGPFGSNLKKEHYTENKEVRIIQLSNVGSEGWRNENVKYTTFAHLKTIERSAVNAGDIVIAKMMPAGRAIIVPDIEKQFVLSSDCVKFVPHSCVLTSYLNYAINSEMFRKQVFGTITGVGRERTSLSKLKNFLIPVPPYAEQVRIVNKISDAMETVANM